MTITEQLKLIYEDKFLLSLVFCLLLTLYGFIKYWIPWFIDELKNIKLK